MCLCDVRTQSGKYVHAIRFHAKQFGPKEFFHRGALYRNFVLNAQIQISIN